MNQQIEAFYPIIGQQAYDAAPIEFKKLWISMEMIDDVSSIGMYCETETGDFHCFYNGLADLTATFYAMRRTFVATGHPPFSSATFILTSTGKFSIDYGYEDVSDFGLGYERQIAWIKQYLGENVKIIQD